jgi:hypothetical protein
VGCACHADHGVRFSFIDRQVLVIPQEPIKAELDLSDTQLGLLTGIIFAALYVILGISLSG